MQTADTVQPRTYGALTFLFDDGAFLVDPRQWCPELAERLADAAGIGPLGPVHWETIGYIRDKYLRLGAIPPMRHVCRRVGLHPGEVKRLFGGCGQLWRIAGLPDPGEEAKAYMD
jgi:tRNA 2-thiouridine synthesizing protein E